MKNKNKKKKLPNPINRLLIEKRVHMTITPNKKDRLEKSDKINKQKGWVDC